MAEINSDTCSASPTAELLSETIGDLFAQITQQLLYQGHYAASAFDLCAGNDIECEAMVSALIQNHDTTFNRIVVDLQGSVNQLVERLRILEAAHD